MNNTAQPAGPPAPPMHGEQRRRTGQTKPPWYREIPAGPAQNGSRSRTTRTPIGSGSTRGEAASYSYGQGGAGIGEVDCLNMLLAFVRLGLDSDSARLELDRGSRQKAALGASIPARSRTRSSCAPSRTLLRPPCSSSRLCALAHGPCGQAPTTLLAVRARIGIWRWMSRYLVSPAS
jgi:hypothetical protein